jgi:hypothetical protein
MSTEAAGETAALGNFKETRRKSLRVDLKSATLEQCRIIGLEGQPVLFLNRMVDHNITTEIHNLIL